MSTTNVWEMEPDDFFGSDIEAFEQEFTTTPLSPTGTATPITHADTLPATSSTPPLSANTCTSPCSFTAPPTRRFAMPKTTEEIERAREQGVPKKTQQDTKYCTGLFEEWRKYRINSTRVDLPPLTGMTTQMLQFWLTRFILEVRKKDGAEFPPNSLHHICAGINRHLRLSGHPDIDIFKDIEFAQFRRSLDSEMKRLQGQGIGSSKRQAETLSESDEDQLWTKGLLGDSTAQSLLDTMVFYNGLYFALRSGKEHRQLRASACQIDVVEHPGERAYLRYTEDISKNHPGGLRGRNVKQKVVIHHENVDNPTRCFFRLFKRYRQLCPPDAPPHAFYLRPAGHPSTTCWYSKRPLGHTKLSQTVARLCSSAGIPGFKTNHSLRATTTSRLYHAGVDEQLVMERTGHRSVEGVRSYKRTSDAQREALSDILNRPATVGAITNTTPVAPAQTLPTIISSAQHSHQLGALSLPSATFNNCQISFHIGPAAGVSSVPTQIPKRRKIRPFDLDSDSD